ncbi:hypothetical protein Atai01_41310 [Amycolatopsis taiwanensis]|uniref:Uncharacterized protein n=2 Tax=Amycolatopsis taiwanensis TaxID=342230 RepID=A0A9W6R4N1_9PSEU|nr:hypothetical protein Atai01_41310 [Amycolatopsis taiwanensis]
MAAQALEIARRAEKDAMKALKVVEEATVHREIMVGRFDVVDLRLDRVESQLTVHKRLLEALRETQVKQGKKIEDGFSMVAVGMSQIAAQIANVEHEIREDKGKDKA